MFDNRLHYKLSIFLHFSLLSVLVTESRRDAESFAFQNVY